MPSVLYICKKSIYQNWEQHEQALCCKFSGKSWSTENSSVGSTWNLGGQTYCQVGYGVSSSQVYEIQKKNLVYLFLL